jgi:hypothetical protein
MWDVLWSCFSKPLSSSGTITVILGKKKEKLAPLLKSVFEVRYTGDSIDCSECECSDRVKSPVVR